MFKGKEMLELVALACSLRGLDKRSRKTCSLKKTLCFIWQKLAQI